MSHSTSPATAKAATSRDATRLIATMEVLLIFVLFFVLAGGAAPDVNEAHYLSKAKHYWNSEWCRGDLFLQSADAHLVFYWTIGWLTQLFSLAAVAWIGRCITWLLLAWSWRRLSVAVVPGRLWSLLTAALFAMILRCSHLAGEWVIGGVEAKGFAFACVFLGLEALVHNRWPKAWVLFGAASAFHVLVGGWSVVAAIMAWLLSKNGRPSLIEMLPALALGGGIALVGLLPGVMLTSGIDADVVNEANKIYVHERLSHHLLFNRILSQPLTLDFTYLGASPLILPYSHLFFLRHMAAIAMGISLWRFVRPNGGSARLYYFAAGALAIAGIGIMIDQATMYHDALAAKLMRYYWFRLSDVMVPLSIALLSAQAIQLLKVSRPVASHWALAGCIVLVTFNTSDLVLRRMHDPKPPAIVQAQPITMTREQADRCYLDWLDTCAWIARHTREDEVFLTPRHQQTFKWYAQRGEVVAWKDIPQDAAGVVEWKRRLDEVFPASLGGYNLTAHGEQELQRLTDKYGARHVVIDRSQTSRPLSFVRVYPERWRSDSCFEVYRVPSLPPNESPD
ncbi:MAG TPA: DUF6798 domain-containing protein [Pirellulaceae bacterium]|nr:DUF6798 domain-containing protein [Pirellulaceae bacterium]